MSDIKYKQEGSFARYPKVTSQIKVGGASVTKISQCKSQDSSHKGNSLERGVDYSSQESQELSSKYFITHCAD